MLNFFRIELVCCQLTEIYRLASTVVSLVSFFNKIICENVCGVIYRFRLMCLMR